MKKTSILFLLFLSLLYGVSFSACKEEEGNRDYQVVGKLNKRVINNISGIEDNLSSIIAQQNMTYSEYILLTTDSAWALPSATQQRLKNLRNSLDTPTVRTLLQKVIPLSEMKTYIRNDYQGTIGGFISIAADMKYLFTLKDVYEGLRLDYPGSKFDSTGIGYAVLRFYTDQPDKISIPYCPSMGGSSTDPWPFGGGGFTTSSLGKGGYPEWIFEGYFPPREGAELYEVNANGYEVLRAVYSETHHWQAADIGLAPTSKSISSDNATTQTLATYAYYKGHRFFLRGIIDGYCHLTTFQPYSDIDLEVVEKGVWGIQVPQEMVSLEQ